MQTATMAGMALLVKATWAPPVSARVPYPAFRSWERYLLCKRPSVLYHLYVRLSLTCCINATMLCNAAHHVGRKGTAGFLACRWCLPC